MTLNGWVQIALFCVLLTLLVTPLGGYMTRVFNGERTLLRPALRPIEVGLYKICGVREDEEQHWVTYAVTMYSSALPASCLCMPCSACRTCCRLIRRTRRGSWARS